MDFLATDACLTYKPTTYLLLSAIGFGLKEFDHYGLSGLNEIEQHMS